jgi:hypothetical protein
MADGETTARIADVLEDAEEPLTAGRIQRRLATESRDVTTGVIREACGELVEAGRADRTDELPPAYRLREG